MSNFFEKLRGTSNMSPLQKYKTQYNTARTNLLLVAIFTVVNLILLVTQSSTYFLFSASIPYILTDLAMFFCGMYPKEVYYGIFLGSDFLDPTVFYVALVISLVLILLYVLAFIFSSKQRVGWLIFALAFFLLDTVGMFVYYGFSTDMIIDIVFHLWVVAYLCLGIYAHFKVKKLEAIESQRVVNEDPFLMSDEQPTDEEN